MSWGGFPERILGVAEDFRIGEDFQKEFKELGRIFELGRISRKNSRSWGRFSNWGGFPERIPKVGEDFRIGEDFQKEFNELGMIFELGRISKKN